MLQAQVHGDLESRVSAVSQRTRQRCRSRTERGLSREAHLVEKARSRLAAPSLPWSPWGAFPGPADVLFIQARPTTLGEPSFLQDSEP